MVGIIGTVVVVLIFAAMWAGVSRERDAQQYLADKHRQRRRRPR